MILIDPQVMPVLFERYLEAARRPQSITLIFESEDAMLGGIPSFFAMVSPMLKGRFIKMEAGVRPNVRERFNRNNRLMTRVVELAEQTGEDAIAAISKRPGWRVARAPHSQLVLIYRDAEQLRCGAKEPLGREAAYKLAALEQGLISPLTVKDIVVRERLPEMRFTLRITVT